MTEDALYVYLGSLHIGFVEAKQIRMGRARVLNGKQVQLTHDEFGQRASNYRNRGEVEAVILW